MNADSLRAEATVVERLAGPDGPVRDWRLIHLPGDIPPWTDTGLRLEAGDDVTWLASGRVYRDEARDVWQGPCFALWGRIGDGPIFKGTQVTTSFTADKAGRLALAVYQGEWATPNGELATPLEQYRGLRGGFDVLVIRWRGEAKSGLQKAREQQPNGGLLAAEVERLAEPIERPPGWHYLWFLGEGDIFATAKDAGRDAIRIRTRNDCGILQRPVSVPLTGATELAWSWKLDRLPGRAAEDQIHTHDYLSIAVEFDNGQDLTYYWSTELPTGMHFRCPLPTWTARETHMVIRSGPDGLDRWHAERRMIAVDYAQAIGGPLPNRVVAIWLIAVSIFGHGNGEGMFADMALSDGETRIAIA